MYEKLSEPDAVQLMGRMGIEREAAIEIFKRCPAAPDGRDCKVVSLNAVQKILEQDQATQALNLHIMAAAIRVEDIEVDRPSYEIER
jgi:hypothetical protein